MTSLDAVGHVVAHALRWQIPGRIKGFSATEVQTGLILPDEDLALFVQWGSSLDAALYTGHAPGPVGDLVVTGHVLSGHLVTITVRTDGNRMRGAGLAGVFVLGQVEQYARRQGQFLATTGGAA